jgi:tetratricopeptide (TPR) repeat protein
VTVLSAEELHRRGVVAMNEGRVPRAQGMFRRALDRTDDSALKARIDASLAYLELDGADLTSALQLVDRVLDAEGLAAETRGVLLAQRAVILRRSGRPADALHSFALAIDVLEGLPHEQGKAFLNRGTVHLDRRDAAAAINDFADAARCYAEAGDGIARAKAEHNQGYALFGSGDLVGALRAMESAATVLNPVGPVVRATCQQDRAEVLLSAGLIESGARLLSEAAADYGRRRLRQRQAEAELVLATHLIESDPGAARGAATRARMRFRRLSAEAWVARADAILLAIEVDSGAAAPTLSSRADLLGLRLAEQGLVWGARAAQLHGARADLRRGDLEVSRKRLGSAPGEGAPLQLRLLDRDVRAELAAASGRRTDALRHLRVGLSELHAWQSSFGSLDLQTGVAGHGTRLGVRGLGLAVESGDPRVLFEWSERARMLASRVQAVRAPDDPELVNALAELREMASARDAGHRPSPERETQLRQRIRERAWQHRGSGEVADPAGIAELAAALGDGTALVAYVVTAQAVVALVVTNHATSWIDLGHRAELDELLGGLLPDLDMAAGDLPDAMGAFVRSELAQRLDAIAGLLVAPVLDAVGDRRVVLTPSGVLSGVPWTLLAGYVGRPLTIAQSATAWLARRTTPLRTASAGFVAGPRVARAEDEVLAAAKEWARSSVLTGADATAAAASALAADVDVLHVAAHGRHSAENAMFAGLQLVDGPWFGYDIDRLHAVPDVVLLSACEVGRSTVRSGDELIGMTTAWLHAGARCVIASPAAINDQAAYDVLIAVHQRLAAGLDPAAALADAVPAASADTAPVPLVCFG